MIAEVSVDRRGAASVTLPQLSRGKHTFTEEFVPAKPGAVGGSTSKKEKVRVLFQPAQPTRRGPRTFGRGSRSAVHGPPSGRRSRSAPSSSGRNRSSADEGRGVLRLFAA